MGSRHRTTTYLPNKLDHDNFTIKYAKFVLNSSCFGNDMSRLFHSGFTIVTKVNLKYNRFFGTIVESTPHKNKEFTLVT